MGVGWDATPYRPTFSHLDAHNIPARNAVSSKFIQIYRRVSKGGRCRTKPDPIAGAAPLRTTPGLGFYPSDGWALGMSEKLAADRRQRGDKKQRPGISAGCIPPQRRT